MLCCQEGSLDVAVLWPCVTDLMIQPTSQIGTSAALHQQYGHLPYFTVLGVKVVTCYKRGYSSSSSPLWEITCHMGPTVFPATRQW